MRLKGLAAVLAAGGALAAAALTGWPRENGYQLIWVVLMALAGFFTVRFFEKKDRRAQWCFGILGWLFVFAMGLGMRLEAIDRTGWSGLMLCALFGALWGPAAGGAALMLSERMEAWKATGEASVKKVFWISMAVLFVCWLPVQLAYFPGCFGYDVNGQVSQIVYSSWHTHHPLVHTLLVCGFWAGGGALGSHTMGILGYVIVQMLGMAAAMAYALSYLAQLRCPRGVRIALTIFLALAPQHPVMAIGVTKDVPFAIFMVLACVELHKLFREPERLRSWKKMLRLALVLICLCLFRNNAPMAIAVFAVAAVILIGRGSRVRMAALLAAVLVGQSAVTAGIVAILDADKGAINEMLSVPAQQLARIYDKYGYDEPTNYEVIEWVPHADMYQASRADFTKLHLKVQREGELVGFLKFWVRELFHFPIEYIDAFLLNAKGYWYPDDKSFATVYGEWPEAQVGALIIEQFDNEVEYTVEYTDCIPWLREIFDSLFVRNNYQSIPGLSTLIHPATYTWMLLYALAWAVWRRKWAVLATGMLMLMYLLTLFLGPCTLVRYCYYLMVAAPILVAMLLAKENQRDCLP